MEYEIPNDFIFKEVFTHFIPVAVTFNSGHFVMN